MKSIFLFGSSTKTGNYIYKNYKFFTEYSNIYNFSSKKDSDFYIDLKSYNFPKGISLNKKILIISLAPIWLFVPYLESILETKKIDNKNILGLIVTSSTSAITKKYAWNKSDQKLSENLIFWEKKLSYLKKKFNLRKVTIVRPTLIYGDIGSNTDKNYNLISNIIKITCVLPIPKETGLRQPIHFSQLGASILNIAKSFNEMKKDNNSLKIINLGGDEELTYEEILLRIRNSSTKYNSFYKPIILKIPNRIFFLFCLPVLIFSPKKYEAILRIATNMNGFKKSYKISGENKERFPVEYDKKKIL